MRFTLPVIVICQFLCTSLWFAGNSVLQDLIDALQLSESYLAHLTSAVQLGFVSGTLVFAFFTISDRYSPSNVFLLSSLVAALCNLGLSLDQLSPSFLLMSRFLTGFFLAGVYPVGMKIAADYSLAGLGKSLGFLVGALVLGTASPHLIRSLEMHVSWKTVIYATSALAVAGGIILWLFVPDGPYRKPATRLKWHTFFSVFRNRSLRSVAFGYFGHMWELYTFWAFVPLLLTMHAHLQGTTVNVALWSFIIIGGGGLACATSGLLSQKTNPKRIAFVALLFSGVCCLLAPWAIRYFPLPGFLVYLIFWGLMVIADSPMFSTLVARHADEQVRGTALTIVNCIGFFITIISLQVIQWLSGRIGDEFVYPFLAIGPVLGLMALWKKPPYRRD